MANAIGPDISFYQNDTKTPQGIDFAKMKQAADFVIIRAGQNLWHDRDFKYNWTEAKKAGLPRGSYWFYDSRVDPKRQAELWCATLGDDLGELPLFADIEENYGSSYQGWNNWYDFLERLKQLVGQKEIGIYTRYYYWHDRAPNEQTQPQNLEYFHQYQLWIAHYTVSQPRIPKPWADNERLFWQYTDKGDGPTYGVESLNIDLNYFNGDKQTFLRRFNLNNGEANYQVDLSIREMPAANSNAAGQLQQNDVLEKLSESTDGEWAQIKRGDGLTGWIFNGFLIKAESTPPPPPPPPTPLPANKWYKVTAVALNVREGPSTSYNVIGTLKQNEVIEGLEFTSDGKWTKIHRESDNLTGWSSSSYLIEVSGPPPPPPPPPAPLATTWFKINATTINVREGPGTNYNVIGSFLKDEILFSTEATSDAKWVKARRFDGLLGWCTTNYLINLGNTAPSEIKQKISNSVIYLRKEIQSPRKIIFHTIVIDMFANGLQFLVTPPSQPDGLLCARKTSQFLADFKMQIAINGNGFKYLNQTTFPPQTYCPNGGEPVKVNSLAASRGKVYAQRFGNHPVLYINQRNEISFNTPRGSVYNAISGYPMLLDKGARVPGLESHTVEPRTAIGANQNGRWLFLTVLDGRQQGYSEGASLPETADFLLSLGAYQAMNMDGGGSSTLVIADPKDQPFILNSPIEGGIPGNEAAVANHLGVIAK
jgi:GH25 family lysozyme M1 (1,4-beta-N-acetylmuramidase)/uncharacterized protein YgiM (DUF1202 family)